MKKDVLIKLVSFAGALVLVAVFTIIKSTGGKAGEDTEVSAIFSDFSSAIDNANELLHLILEAEENEKIRELAQSLSEELRRAQQDYTLLNSHNVESALDTFLNLSGDFVLKYADDKTLGQTSRDQEIKLENLKAVAEKFSEELSRIEPLGDAEKITEEIRKGYVKANKEAVMSEEGESFSSVSQSQPEEITDSGNPLENAKQINVAQATKIAGDYLDTEELIAKKTEENGIEVYSFENEEEKILISVRGGFVVSFTRNGGGEIKNFSEEQCLLKAEEFMKAYHSANFTPRYFVSDEMACFIVFTTKNGATFCNPDRAEITVSKISGEIVSFSACDFLKNHRNRTLQAPIYTAEQAKSALGSGLKDEQVWQVITAAFGEEKMCFEFYCLGPEKEGSLVYISAVDLKIEGQISVPENKNFAFLK